MSTPNYIFIDTCILDQQNYNFSSVALSAFVLAIKGRELKLILPDPTRREIKRHIRKRADDAVKALEEARRNAPFLSKWKKWPIKKSGGNLEWELREIAITEWERFLENFSVVEIDYDSVNIGNVMDWYDDKTPPFGEGKKSKEFPDAFTLASLFEYAKKQGASVAVISTDNDFRKACERYPELSYFSSLPAYSEALISGDARVKKIKEAIEEDPSLLLNTVKSRVSDLSFYHADSFEADISDVEVNDVELKDLKIVHIGDKEAVVSFKATIDYSAHVRIDDEDTTIVDSEDDVRSAIFEYRGSVFESTEISGVAKCAVRQDWGGIENIVHFEMDDAFVIVFGIPEDIYLKGE